MANFSKIKHLLDIGDAEPFNMTAPENLTAKEETVTPEDDPSAFEPAVESEEPASPTVKSPGPLASQEEIAKIQSLPLPEAQKSTRTPAQAEQPTPAVQPSNDDSSAISDRRKYLEEMLNSVKNLKSAQQNYKDQLSNIGILQGGNQIAQAMAAGYGGKIGDGSDAIKSLKEQAYRPVQEIEENLKMGQEDVKASNAAMELQRLEQAADKKSPISQLARQQAATGMAMLTGAKRGSPEFDAAVQKYMKQFEGMSALDLEKGAFGKTGLLGKSPTTAGFGQFIDAKSGHPLISRSFMGQTEVVDAVTGQVVDPSNATIVRPIGYNDPQTGNRGYLTPSGMLIPGQDSAQHPGSATSQEQAPKEYTMADLNKINPKFADKQINSLREMASHDEELKKIREANRSAGVLFTKLEGLDPEHPGDIDSGLAPSLAAQMASMAQGGNSRIAAEFINKYSGAGGLEARINRYIEDNLAGKLTDQDRSFFAEAGAAFKKAGDEMYAPLAKNYGNQLKSLFPDLKMSDENAQKLLGLDQSLVLSNKPMEDYKKNVGDSKIGTTDILQGKVRVRLPNGKTGQIDKDKLQQFLNDHPGSKEVK